MFKKGSLPWIFGLVGLGLWCFCSTAFYLTLPADRLLSHLLTSWVNAVSFYLTAATFGFIYERNKVLNAEANWKEGALLPQWILITDHEQIKQHTEKMGGTELDKRPNALVYAPLVALCRQWARLHAHSALDAKYKILKTQITSRYRVWFVLANVITGAGIFGTMLGMSQALPHIEDLGLFRGSLYVAFDTSLVSIFLGQVVRYSLALLQNYDENVLNKVYEVVFDHLIQAIRDTDDLRPGEHAPAVKKPTVPKKPIFSGRKAPVPKPTTMGQALNL